jgi:hypothetical protein
MPGRFQLMSSLPICYIFSFVLLIFDQWISMFLFWKLIFKFPAIFSKFGACADVFPRCYDYEPEAQFLNFLFQLFHKILKPRLDPSQNWSVFILCIHAVCFHVTFYVCSEQSLLIRACNQLGQFLTHKETNLR